MSAITWITPRIPYAQMEKVWELLHLVPGPRQRPFFESPANVRVIYGGWRAGKSLLSVMALIGYLVFWRNIKRQDGLAGLIWIIGPDYKQAEAEFNYFEEFCRKLGILKSVYKPQNAGWMLQTVTGWQVETRSSMRLASLGSVTLDAVILAEANQHEEQVLHWCMGRLAETSGPLILSGTLEEGNPWYPALSHTYPTFPNEANLQWFSLPTWSNPIFSGEDDPRLKARKAITPWNIWQVRYGGVPAPPAGAVWDEFRKVPDLVHAPDGTPRTSKPIAHVWSGAEYDPRREVYLAVDPGEVYAVCAFHWVTLYQTRHDNGQDIAMPGMLIFDEVHIPHGFFDRVREQLLGKPWFREGMTSYHDRATKQHHNQRSQEDLWRTPVADGGLGAQVLYDAQVLRVRTGVELMHRWLLHPLTQEPLLYINPRCTETIREFGEERYPRDSQHTQAVEPVDKHNHHRKALTYAINVRHGTTLQIEDEVKSELAQKKTWYRRLGY